MGSPFPTSLWENNPMLKRPKGQKRPADVIGTAIMVAKIATGEIEEDVRAVSGRAKSGRKGAPAGIAPCHLMP